MAFKEKKMHFAPRKHAVKQIPKEVSYSRFLQSWLLTLSASPPCLMCIAGRPGMWRPLSPWGRPRSRPASRSQRRGSRWGGTEGLGEKKKRKGNVYIQSTGRNIQITLCPTLQQKEGLKSLNKKGKLVSLYVSVFTFQHLELFSRYPRLILCQKCRSKYSLGPGPASPPSLAHSPVDLTKKFPWKVCGTRPRVQRIRITASNPILRVRYRLKNKSDNEEKSRSKTPRWEKNNTWGRSRTWPPREGWA